MKFIEGAVNTILNILFMLVIMMYAVIYFFGKPEGHTDAFQNIVIFCVLYIINLLHDKK